MPDVKPRVHHKQYTYEYQQPAEYAFCQDSVLAPLAIANDLEAYWQATGAADFSNYRALDVCAGCGVMGLELTHALPQLEQFDFLEIQSAFREPFAANAQMVQASRSAAFVSRWLEQSYASLQSGELRNRYDLIVCNPPYFDLGEGTLPPNPVKQRARFFVDDTFESLLKSLRAALKPEGRAYVLMKSGKKHGRDAFTLARSLLSDCEIQIVADIRGTGLVRIVAPALTSPSEHSQA